MIFDDKCMIVGGQTGTRAQLSSTILDYHVRFDQGLKSVMALSLFNVLAHIITISLSSIKDYKR